MGAQKFAVTDDQMQKIEKRMIDIRRQLEARDGSPLDPAFVAAVLQHVIEGGFLIEIIKSLPPITVDYGLSLEKILEMGKYDKDCFPAPSFPAEAYVPKLKGAGQIQMDLIHPMLLPDSVEGAELRFSTMGYRSATIPEVGALGAAFPEIQRAYRILGLGSFLQMPGGVRLYPQLLGSFPSRHFPKGGRNFRFVRFTNGIPSGCSHALAVVRTNK